MRMRVSLFAVLLCSVAAAALAAPIPEPGEVKAPAGQPPVFVVVHAVNKDAMTLESQQTVTVTEYQTRQQEVVQGGVKQIVPVTVAVPKQVTQTSSYSLKGATAHDSEGKAVPMDEVFKRLKKGMPVVIAQGGKPLDPAFLKLLSKEALVIVPPAADPNKTPPPPPPPPVPPGPPVRPLPPDKN